ncbi:non-ribosomal peptide synthetase [Hyphococcus lacteus]|uniref:Amino acid adenylation domain-containing protein n=1 Tax=Hyphococcus lacteus TaxID=3143536 RepID=A0ABV3Z302_9PROT
MIASRKTSDKIHIFMDEWARKGVEFSLHEGGLKVSAPKGMIDAAAAEKIRALKADILEVLENDGGPGIAKISRVERSDQHQLGYVQQRIWAHEQMQPDTILYQLPAAWRLDGPLEIGTLNRALNKAVIRHEILRSRFSTIDGSPVQQFVDHEEFAIPITDLSETVADKIDDELRRQVLSLRDTPLNLTEGQNFRTHLFRISSDNHLFFFMPHHLVWDGWCFDIFLRDLSALYNVECEGIEAPLPALEFQYVDYAQWHRDWLGTAFLERELSFWTENLSTDTPPLALPLDNPRPALFNHAGDCVEFELDSALCKKIRAFAEKHHCTHFAVLLSAWQCFLMRITGQTDIVVGVPVQARHQPAVSDVIGCFVNTLCLRQKVRADASFAEMLSESNDFFVRAYEYQDAPVDMLAEHLIDQRDPSRTPIFQTMFTHQHVNRRPKSVGALTLTQYFISPGATPVDLELGIMESDDQIHGELIYCTSLFEERTINHLSDCFQVFLLSALESSENRIADLEILSLADNNKINKEWNKTEAPYNRDVLACDYFDRCAHEDPEKTAIQCAGNSISFEALRVRSNKIANYLKEIGIGPGDFVGIFLDRSIDMVAVMLGVWKSGAAYLPLDPSFPETRITYMLSDAGAKAVVTAGDTQAFYSEIDVRIIDLEVDKEEINAVSGDDVALTNWDTENPAYIIYTSGSTGNPKGVVNSHRALCNFLEAMVKTPGISRDDRLLAVTTISFDISILEIFLPLSVGATLIVATADDVVDGIYLSDLIDHQNITIMQATPATWRLLLDADWQGAPKLKALCGGEPLPAVLASALLPRVASLWNMYGPTETTIWSTCEKIESADDINVGRPIANTKTYVLDQYSKPVPIGVVGDLWIGGDGVAIGYHKRPDITADKFQFIKNSSTDRIYNTGDRARWRQDGKLEILGRDDDQVKLRGYRIELGEIETALSNHEALAQAAAAIHTDPDGEASLVGYVVFKEGDRATGSELRKWLRRSLPQYMIPQFFTPLSALPLTNNNKVDRKALPAPSGDVARVARVAPRTEAEQAMAAIWADLLKAPDISVTDNFFELGGQSLQVAQMVVRVREKMGLFITPRAVIFETLEQLVEGAAPQL